MTRTQKSAQPEQKWKQQKQPEQQLTNDLLARTGVLSPLFLSVSLAYPPRVLLVKKGDHV